MQSVPLDSVSKLGFSPESRSPTAPICEHYDSGYLSTYIGEGFDDARLDTLFLAMPISWKGTLQQYVGPLHRLHNGKRVVEVYHYVDPNVVMLARMYERRLKGCDMGYKISGGLNEQPCLI